MVLERIADFLGALLQRHDQMSSTTQQILDKLTAQGAQIDQLVADKNAKEQADLDRIDALIESNSAKVTAALAPAPTSASAETVTGAVTG